MVRTLIEIQGGRVNVRETPEETTVSVTVDDLTTALTLTRTSRQFNRARVIELEAELARETAARQTSDRVRQELALRLVDQEGQESEACRRVIELTDELEAERERADENRAWAERAESQVAAIGLDLAHAKRAIQILGDQLGRVSGAVHSPELVHNALRCEWTSWSEREAAALTTAIIQVREALGSPRLPEPIGAATSQA